MKIAVIDSGVNTEFIQFNKLKLNQVNLCEENNSLLDFSGHGTSTIGEIVFFIDDIEIVSIKILNEDLKCSLKKLVEALEYCLNDKEITIINLSLSCYFKDDNLYKYIHKLIDELYKCNKLIICSIDNHNYISYPSLLDKVLGVKFQYINNSQEFFIFDKEKNNCVYFAPIRIMPKFENKYGFYFGNSAACAKMSGIISKYSIKNAKELKRFLEINQKKNNSSIIQNTYEIKSENIIDIIFNFYNNKKEHKDIDKKNINIILHLLKFEDYIEILNQMQCCYNIKLDFIQFTSFDFFDIKNLIKKINTSIIT